MEKKVFNIAKACLDSKVPLFDFHVEAFSAIYKHFTIFLFALWFQSAEVESVRLFAVVGVDWRWMKSVLTRVFNLERAHANRRRNVAKHKSMVRVSIKFPVANKHSANLICLQTLDTENAFSTQMR